MKTAASATASNVFMFFILGSFLGTQKGSNIQPRAASDVAQDLLAFAIHLALFRPITYRLTRRRALLLSTPHEISARFNDKDRCLHHRAEAAWNEEIRHRVAVGTTAHLQPDLHGLRPDSRIFHFTKRHFALGRLPRGGRGMQRADDFNLRRGTADLYTDQR